jgi:hypothetical protein
MNNPTTTTKGSICQSSQLSQNQLIEFINDLKDAIQNGHFNESNNNTTSSSSSSTSSTSSSTITTTSTTIALNETNTNLTNNINLKNVNNLSNQTFSYIISWLKHQQQLAQIGPKNEQQQQVRVYIF